MVDASKWMGRVESLLLAIKDLDPNERPRTGSAGSSRHQDLFAEYVQALHEAKEIAEGWWGALIDTEEDERTGDREQAIKNVEERRPVGPVAHGAVIEVIRRYWLSCAALNGEVAEMERVPPEEFVLRWLLKPEHEDYARFLSTLPFWPMGFDGERNWV